MQQRILVAVAWADIIIGEVGKIMATVIPTLLIGALALGLVAVIRALLYKRPRSGLRASDSIESPTETRGPAKPRARGGGGGDGL